MRAYYGGPLVGQQLSFLREHMPNADTRVAAIYRDGRAIVPQGTTVIEADDEVFFIAAREHINSVMAELRKVERPFRRVMIAGGGHIGESLAAAIEAHFSVKIIEYSASRCDELANSLSDTVVLNGDATDQDLLLEENIESCDVFCAVTNDDEVNIMSSLMAKRLGVRQVMTLISKPAYVDLVQGGEIDIAISPQQATTSSCSTTCAKQTLHAYTVCGVAQQKHWKPSPTVMPRAPNLWAGPFATSNCRPARHRCDC